MNEGKENFKDLCKDLGGDFQNDKMPECKIDSDEIRFGRSSIHFKGSGRWNSPFNTDLDPDHGSELFLKLNGMEIDSLPSGYDPSVDIERVEELSLTASGHATEIYAEFRGDGTFRG